MLMTSPAWIHLLEVPCKSKIYDCPVCRHQYAEDFVPRMRCCFQGDTHIILGVTGTSAEWEWLQHSVYPFPYWLGTQNRAWYLSSACPLAGVSCQLWPLTAAVLSCFTSQLFLSKINSGGASSCVKNHRGVVTNNMQEFRCCFPSLLVTPKLVVMRPLCHPPASRLE